MWVQPEGPGAAGTEGVGGAQPTSVGRRASTRFPGLLAPRPWRTTELPAGAFVPGQSVALGGGSGPRDLQVALEGFATIPASPACRSG